MGILSIMMTAIGLSMDAFAVALAKGMILKKDIVKNAIKISLFFGAFQGLMPLLGWFAGRYFEGYIKSFDHWIAFILLAIIGGKMIYESNKSDDDEKLEKENDGLEVSNKELIILAIATSIDALAVGVSFAFLNVDILPSVIIIGLTTFLLCIIAVVSGRKLGAVFQKYAEVIGGVILLFIGMQILIEHIL